MQLNPELIAELAARPEYQYMVSRMNELDTITGEATIEETFNRWTDPLLMAMLAMEVGHGDDKATNHVVMGMVLALWLVQYREGDGDAQTG